MMNVRTKSTESLGSPPRTLHQDSMMSWTDDLPVCHLSGVGFSTNQIYREDGQRQEDHEFEDRSFHFRLDDQCFLYGVFDGHNGSNASKFAAQRLPAELLFGQLRGNADSNYIKDTLTQAFLAVEKSFFEQMDKALAERATLLLHLPEGVSAYEVYQCPPDISSRLEILESQIAGGTTAVIALVLYNTLYVANVGDTRALLVRVGDNGVLIVTQLSEDHTICNERELERLAQLGLDIDLLRHQRRIGTSDNTRCIGDYHVKGGRSDIEYLRCAAGEPVVAEPSVTGGMVIDETDLFLIVISDGLYHALQDATGTEHVNADIAAMVAEEFNLQSTLNGVAQAVVDKVVRIHNDTYLMGLQEKKQICQKRGDVTLLVRNFNCPLPNAINSPTGGGRFCPVSVPFHKTKQTTKPSLIMPSDISRSSQSRWKVASDEIPSPTPQMTTPTNTLDLVTSTVGSSTNASTNVSTNVSTNSTQSNEDTRLFSRRKYETKLELDENGCIEAYVDFSEFYNALNKLSDSQQAELMDELMPKTGYDPIIEVDTPTDEGAEFKAD